MIEIPFWLVLSLLVVLIWGIGENCTKKATDSLRAPTMLLLYAWAALVVWGGYWYLMGHPLMPLTSIATIAGVIASIFFAIGMIFYYEALDESLYLFSWDNVPGNDSERLLRSLMDDFDIGWAENAEIRKSDDGKTIHVFRDGYSAEIMIDDKKEKATIKISDGRTHDLNVKTEDGKLNIYVSFSKISVVSPITGAHPIITVLLAVIFLNEIIHIFAAFGIAFVILGTILLGIKEKKPNKKIYFLIFLCFMLWGFGDVLAKFSIDMSSHVNFMLFYFLIGFIIWNLYYITYSKERMPSNNGTKKVGILWGVLSVALFTIGSIFLYLAFESGLVSLVSPITSAYPILTVVIAHSLLKEKLTSYQKIAITLFIFGTILIGVI